MFKQYFFYWLTFFLVCLLIGGSVFLHLAWNAEKTLDEARTLFFIGRCLDWIGERSLEETDPRNWNLEGLHAEWGRRFSSVSGVAVVDTVVDETISAAGSLRENAAGLPPDPGDANVHWLEDDLGNRYWTSPPAGGGDPRFRIWVRFQPIPGFRQAVLETRTPLAVVVVCLSALFLLFYRFWGAPARYLDPITRSIQRSLDHGDDPIQIPPTDFPAEFAQPAKSLSLLFERRKSDREEARRLADQAAHMHHQRDRYTVMVSALKSNREREKRSLERLRTALLEANRDPVVVLESGGRIVATNETARRVLSLGGRTGSTFKHPEIEAILDAELGPRKRSADRKIRIRDPIVMGKISTWRVNFSVQREGNDCRDYESLVLWLTLEDRQIRAGGHAARDLLDQYQAALGEAWKGQTKVPSPLDEREGLALEGLTRALFRNRVETSAVEAVLEGFRVEEASLEPSLARSRIKGPHAVWSAFSDWFGYLVERMAGVGIAPTVREIDSERIRIEWEAVDPIPVDRWFGEGGDATRRFRKRTLQWVMERYGAKAVWDPARARLFSIEFKPEPSPSSGRLAGVV